MHRKLGHELENFVWGNFIGFMLNYEENFLGGI
jgi:hypothetical protein